jgi:hypothetical protein
MNMPSVSSPASTVLIASALLYATLGAVSTPAAADPSAVQNAVTSAYPCYTGYDPISKTCSYSNGAVSWYANASLELLSAVANVDLAANLAYNSSATVIYYVELGANNGSTEYVPMWIHRRGYTEVGGAGHNYGTATISIDDSYGSAGWACSGSSPCNPNRPPGFSGTQTVNWSPGVHKVEVTAEAGVNGNGGGDLISFAHAGADPYIEIDSTFLALHPGVYSLAFSGNITNAPLDVPALERGRHVAQLRQNVPNPCTGSTLITFSLPEAAEVSLTLYDLSGRKVATLLTNELRRPGVHQVEFSRRGLDSGVYFYRLRAGRTDETKRMVVFDGKGDQ